MADEYTTTGAGGPGWTPKRDFDHIRQLAIQMQNARSPVIQRMLDVQRHYDGDLVVPLPDLKNEPDMPNLTPQLITNVVDGLAMRASSVMPIVRSPAIRPAELASKNKAINRQRIIAAVYDKSGWLLGRRRAMRHLNAYETMALVVEPDMRNGMPRLRVRNPLEAFPEEKSQENLEPPSYVAFITRHSGSHLRSCYPKLMVEYGGPITMVNEHQLWDVLEWYDDEQIRFGLLGPVEPTGEHLSAPFVERNGGPWMPLTDPIPNKAGRCLAYCPQAVTLHRIGNRLNRLLENAKWQNRLMALDILAQEKAIFPDMVMMSSQGRTPRIVGGRWKDGREGEVNLVEGADRIHVLNTSPDPRTGQAIDRLERNARVDSGWMPQWGGETGGAALRTGRALGAMSEISVDPRIQELHEVDEVWMRHVNAGILACFKGWWPRKKYTLFSGWPTDDGQVEFTPADEIETVENTVSYAIPGADVTQISMVLGGLHGSELMSSATAQELHPYIKNPEGEQRTITQEQLDRAMREGLMQQVATGQMPIEVYSEILEMYRSDDDLRLEQCVNRVGERVRREQLAAQEAAMAQQQQLGLSAMPGLAAGPAAAAPGMPGPAPLAPGQSGGASPTATARQVLQAANPLGG